MSVSLIKVGEERWVHLQRNRLVLEELTAQDESRYGQNVLAVIGKVRVTNLAFQKNVFARITFNNWTTYRDYSGSYIESSKDGTTDVFAFGFTRRDKKPVSVEFALCCSQDGKEFWDSNDGKNYTFYLSEDPLNQSAPDEEKEEEAVIEPTSQPEVEETPPSLEKEMEEISFDTFTYAHFQAHPLTPTKTNLYSSFHNAPEAEIVSVKAANNKHVLAYNALAIEDLLNDEKTPGNLEDGQIEATCATLAEEGVCMTDDNLEQNDNNEQVGVMPEQNHVQEESIEPVKLTKPVDEQTTDDVFDKLEKEKEETLRVQLQIIEEPGDAAQQTEDGERNGTAAASEQVRTEEERKPTDEEQPSVIEEGKQKDKKKSKDEKKKKNKKEKKKTKKGKNEEKTESEQKSADDQSLSSRKEKIDNEPPKKPKKGFLTRMACCGKAEPD